MGAGDAKAKFVVGVGLEGRSETVAYASELEKLHAEIKGSTDAMKAMQATNRALRGSSDEVKGAKKELAAQIDKEKDAISRANLALLKHGTTYTKVAEEAKKAAHAEAEVSKPVKELQSKLEELDKALLTGTGQMGLAIVGATALGAAVVELGVKTAETALDIAKFDIVSADAVRSMALQREAAAGGAENAKNWGTQIDALARKVPTSTEKLNELSVSLSKALSGGQSRASGQTIIDTFNAEAEAASAMGDDAGSAIEGIIAEGKRFGRIGLDPTTLQGKWNTGWEDISKSVAKNLGVSVGAAKLALMQHQVTIDAGAKAIRDAVETRFGEINAKKLISLDSISTKLHDDWVNLTKGFNLDPILEGIKKVVDLFDTTSVEGYALKQLFTDLGTGLGANVDDGVGVAKFAVDEFIIALQDLEIWVLENKKEWAQAFDDAGGIDGLKTDVVELKDDVEALAHSLELVIKAASALKTVADIGTSADKTVGNAAGIIDSAKQGDGKGAAIGAAKLVGGALAGFALGPAFQAYKAGKDLAFGVTEGVHDGSPSVNKAMSDMAAGGIDAARGPKGADAHSPSRKGKRLGTDIADGTVEGVSGGQGDVDDAMAAMGNPAAAAAGRSAGGAGAGGGGAAPVIHLELVVNADSKAKGAEIAASLTEASFLAKLTREIVMAAQRNGVATAQVPT